MTQTIFEITENINENTTFYRKNIYVIIGEIHVKSNITLIIEDDTLIFIKNGTYPNSILKKSVLIFDTGSTLFGNNIYFIACDSTNNRTYIKDNGGIWFVGSSFNAEKEGIHSYYSPLVSRFEAHKIYAFYLGSKDPLFEVSDNGPSADNDGITILGCSDNEWKILNIFIQESGDNGMDIVQSYITINELEIIYPGEDAVNLQSATLNILQKFKGIVPLNNEYDRDIFDFETDNGPSKLRIQQYCDVELVGIFGDELKLISYDLQQPTEGLYFYKGITQYGQTFIYTENHD